MSFGKKQCVSNLDQDSFTKLLLFAMNKFFFVFNNTFCKQLHGLAMGSPLGPILAN